MHYRPLHLHELTDRDDPSIWTCIIFPDPLHFKSSIIRMILHYILDLFFVTGKLPCSISRGLCLDAYFDLRTDFPFDAAFHCESTVCPGIQRIYRIFCSMLDGAFIHRNGQVSLVMGESIHQPLLNPTVGSSHYWIRLWELTHDMAMEKYGDVRGNVNFSREFFELYVFSVSVVC